MSMGMGSWGAAQLAFRWWVRAVAEWRAPAWDASMRRF